MPKQNDFAETFLKLKAILKPYAGRLIVVHDTDYGYHIDTKHVMKNKRRLFFGAVLVGNAYVSFHLMPVYACTDMRERISPELKKHMQGKSCFNFKAVDQKLFKELAGLTKAGFAKFNDAKFLEKVMG